MEFSDWVQLKMKILYQGNIFILLSPLELKSDFTSIETPWPGVNCHHFISFERPSLQVERQLHILFRNWLFHKDGGCFKRLLSARISFTCDNTENFQQARFYGA